jgi:excisionase family DNA binding protein
MHAQPTALPAGQDTTSHDPAAESGRIAYTVAEVATLLGKHPNTVYGWVAKGELPHQRIGGTIYIPTWALAGLLAPDTGTGTVAEPGDGSAAAPPGGAAA